MPGSRLGLGVGPCREAQPHVSAASREFPKMGGGVPYFGNKDPTI